MATRILDVINDVARILLDETGTRWAKQELLDYFNESMQQIIVVRNDAKTLRYFHVCTASTAQTLDIADYKLLDVTTNRYGRAILPMAKEVLDMNIPDWRNPATESDSVDYWAYNDKYPNTFFVYPKPKNGVQIEIITSRVPDKVQIGNFNADIQVMGINDVYQSCVINYMLFRALSKDSKAGNPARADYYLNLFNAGLGIKTQVDLTGSPQKPYYRGQQR